MLLLTMGQAAYLFAAAFSSTTQKQSKKARDALRNARTLHTTVSVLATAQSCTLTLLCRAKQMVRGKKPNGESVRVHALPLSICWSRNLPLWTKLLVPKFPSEHTQSASTAVLDWDCCRKWSGYSISAFSSAALGATTRPVHAWHSAHIRLVEDAFQSQSCRSLVIRVPLCALYAAKIKHSLTWWQENAWNSVQDRISKECALRNVRRMLHTSKDTRTPWNACRSVRLVLTGGLETGRSARTVAAAGKHCRTIPRTFSKCHAKQRVTQILGCLWISLTVCANKSVFLGQF